MSGRTIFALSSGSPPAGIAVIRVSGPDAHRAGKALARNLPSPREAAVRELRDSAGLLLDRALVLRFDAPASATGEDVVEFHCHGGRAVAAGVLNALAEIDGLIAAKPGEFTRRAFDNGRIDLTEAEGLADLLEAETASQRRAALALAEGGLRREIEAWQARVLDLSARAEAAIDYVEDDGVEDGPELSADCAALADEVGASLARPRSEPLREGLRVVIAGPPNAGKSSLFNALSGYERAIVADVPGTTRDSIDVPLAISGVPVRLTDTAGLHATDDRVERQGVERALALVTGADILLWLGDPLRAPDHERMVRVHPRSDVAGREICPDGSIAVSSKTGTGLAQITAAIVEHGRTILPGEGVIALNSRQAECMGDAHELLSAAADAPDLVIAAECLRGARSAFDRLTGRAGVEDLLDSLFGRFCLGK